MKRTKWVFWVLICVFEDEKILFDKLKAESEEFRSLFARPIPVV
ncbi:MAG: hypothetical protein ACOCW1_04585 [Chitinispirillaceae bacterium]